MVGYKARGYGVRPHPVELRRRPANHPAPLPSRRQRRVLAGGDAPILVGPPSNVTCSMIWRRVR
ncbi:hypothetical protein HanIR_Chr13g0642381 [Helianthus annuus]|nr:hypothetical protein HanIR_Chr13g0642381 [Helianthus annuus]